MQYNKVLKMQEELRFINSNFVSISRDDYNSLLEITEEGTVCINSEKEVELDIDDLKSLVHRCIGYYIK